MIQEHNRASANVWSRGGAGYDFVSFGISDALSHATQLLWPQPGERILDVATGTGWSARNAASMGAEVTAVDIADELLSAAKRLSSHVHPSIEFKLADAEELPFKDGQFDGVISTFGVMFAGNHLAAANELCRVCRPGGRLVLATWVPGPHSFVARLFAVIGKHGKAPPPEHSPLDWGRSEYLGEILGKCFALEIRNEVSIFYAPDGAVVWEKFYKGFGPVRQLADRLDQAGLSAFREDFVALHEEFRTGEYLRIDREYLLIRGVRK